MAELRGKGWRVAGYFLWMLGVGFALEGQSPWTARTLLGVGLALFVGGVIQSYRERGTRTS